MRTYRRSAFWLVPIAIAVVEVIGHFVVQARVVTDDDWHRAAERVRSEWEEGDVIAAAPEWTDPIVRRELGNRIRVADAGRSDLARYRRLWAMSVRGHRPREAPPGEPEFDEQVGPVRVLRWALEQERIIYDFVSHVREARVTIDDRLCPWQRGGRPRGGGLSVGPMVPAQRHQCDQRRSWLWVGTTVLEDLDLMPRSCIWQHPAAPEVIRATFANVPLGDRIVLAGGINYEHERELTGGPLSVVIRLDGHEIGRMIHRDGDGWKRMTASTRIPSRGDAERGEISVEVTAPDPDRRTFCWAATVRGEAR